MLHFADVHIGMENYGRIDPATGTSTRVRDFLDRLDEVIDFALQNDVDLVVFAGDAFKSRDPDPTQQREFAQRIKRLSDAAPTLLLVGNHDMPAMPAKASSVDIFRALGVPGVVVGHRPDGRVVETKRGNVFLAWMPYPMRNRLLARGEHSGKTINELELALRQEVTNILRALAERADTYEMPRVLAGHFSVAEAKLGSERSVMLGKDVAMASSDLAEAAWDYVALGHIHKHQVLNQDGYPPVVYSGSLERIDFGEEGEPKGFCWVELRRAQTTWSFQEVDARPFVTVRVDARGALDVTTATQERLVEVEQGAIVRVIVQLRDDQQPGLREREIQASVPQATSINIAREVEVEARTRLGDLAPEALSPIELIEEYFRARGASEGRIRELSERARELLG